VGRSKVHWTESRTVTDSDGSSHTETDHYQNEENYFLYEASIWKKNTLSPGSHTFPFSFLLPQNIPSTFKGNFIINLIDKVRK